jgi:hypothetical protein
LLNSMKKSSFASCCVPHFSFEFSIDLNDFLFHFGPSVPVWFFCGVQRHILQFSCLIFFMRSSVSPWRRSVRLPSSVLLCSARAPNFFCSCLFLVDFARRQGF